MKNSRTPLSIFITGIAGFIGFHLALFLKKRGDYVIGCDNFNDYYSLALKKKRSAYLTEQGICVIPCDLHQIATLTPLFTQTRFSHLVHLAAQAGVRYSISHPHTYSAANLAGTLHVLEMCRNFRSIRLIFASSSSVYGNQPPPFVETNPTDSPISLYAATKKSAELLAKSYHHLYQIPTTALRLFTCYGPWGRPDMAYFSFAKSIVTNRPIDLFQGGTLRRDFTYIDDTISGITAAIDLQSDDGYQVYNLGSGKASSVIELVQYLEKGLGKKAVYSFKPMQLGDTLTTLADTTKARNKLRFSPKTSLEEGIQKFARWFLKITTPHDALCLLSSTQEHSTPLI